MSEAAEVYAHFREVFGGKTTSLRARLRRLKAEETAGDDERSEPFGPGRDPVAVGDALDRLLTTFSWSKPIAEADLVTRWPEIVGAEVAQHAVALHLDKGVLVVQCDSTAWATQLRTLRTSLVTKCVQACPDAGMKSIQFLNPGAPSWKHGRRSVPGRGVRDTYG